MPHPAPDPTKAIASLRCAGSPGPLPGRPSGTRSRPGPSARTSRSSPGTRTGACQGVRNWRTGPGSGRRRRPGPPRRRGPRGHQAGPARPRRPNGGAGRAARRAVGGANRLCRRHREREHARGRAAQIHDRRLRRLRKGLDPLPDEGGAGGKKARGERVGGVPSGFRDEGGVSWRTNGSRSSSSGRGIPGRGAVPQGDRAIAA